MLQQNICGYHLYDLCFVILTFFYFDTSRCFASAGINLEVENICWYKLYDLCFCYINIFLL